MSVYFKLIMIVHGRKRIYGARTLDGGGLVLDESVLLGFRFIDEQTPHFDDEHFRLIVKHHLNVLQYRAWGASADNLSSWQENQ